MQSIASYLINFTALAYKLVGLPFYMGFGRDVLRSLDGLMLRLLSCFGRRPCLFFYMIQLPFCAAAEQSLTGAGVGTGRSGLVWGTTKAHKVQ